MKRLAYCSRNHELARATDSGSMELRFGARWIGGWENDCSRTGIVVQCPNCPQDFYLRLSELHEVLSGRRRQPVRARHEGPVVNDRVVKIRSRVVSL